jgi:hypothetical protein
MTSHAGRLYALALALVVFFLTWAAIAARPWTAESADPRLTALRDREARLHTEARLVQRIVADRWAAYRRALQARRSAVASAAPAVRIVTLPPLTITRTS